MQAMQNHIIRVKHTVSYSLFNKGFVLEKQLIYMIFGNTAQWIVLFKPGWMENTVLRLEHRI